MMVISFAIIAFGMLCFVAGTAYGSIYELKKRRGEKMHLKEGDYIICTGLKGEFEAGKNWLTIGKVYRVNNAYTSPEYKSGQNGTITDNRGDRISFNFGTWKKVEGFEKGDVVKLVRTDSDYCTRENHPRLNKISTVVNGTYFENRKFSVQLDSGFCVKPEHLILIERGSVMDRYSEITAIVSKIEGWTKQVDDILLEIYKNFNGGWFNIRISPCERGHIRILLDTKTREMIIKKTEVIHESINGYGGQYWVEFKYDGQCEKNRKFKEAILWLLHHSEIKKPSYLTGKRFYDKEKNKIFEVRFDNGKTILCGRDCDFYGDAHRVINAYDLVYDKSRLDHCKEIVDPDTMSELEYDRDIKAYRVKDALGIVGQEVRADIGGKIYKVKVLSRE